MASLGGPSRLKEPPAAVRRSLPRARALLATLKLHFHPEHQWLTFLRELLGTLEENGLIVNVNDGCLDRPVAQVDPDLDISRSDPHPFPSAPIETQNFALQEVNPEVMKDRRGCGSGPGNDSVDDQGHFLKRMGNISHRDPVGERS